MNDRTPLRALALLGTALLTSGAFAGTDAPVPSDGFVATREWVYGLVILAVTQTVLIISLASIMRSMSGPGGWVRNITRHGGRAAVLFPLVLTSLNADAQAYAGDQGGMGPNDLFWILVGVNVFLFIILLTQLNLIRLLTRTVFNVEAPTETAEPVRVGPSWSQRLVRRMTRQVAVAEEKDIELGHEYDGIKELDNVLPPWWLWLFYGSIAWSVFYMINAHMADVWPTQEVRYEQEMAQARADVDAYLATLTNTVDENNVTRSDDPEVIAKGRGLFAQNCVACHGADAAGSETSVGPNLTDAYWLHGGGVKNVFHTIKYGVPEKGMISWKSQLEPTDIRAIASYILTLQGTGGPTQKAPQGEPWKEEGAPTDSTAAAVDSSKATSAETEPMAVH